MSQPKAITNKQQYCTICMRFVDYECSFPDICKNNPKQADDTTITSLLFNRFTAKFNKKK